MGPLFWPSDLVWVAMGPHLPAGLPDNFRTDDQRRRCHVWMAGAVEEPPLGGYVAQAATVCPPSADDQTEEGSCERPK